MEIVKNRRLAPGQRVQVYYNLHQGGYSIKDKATGLVVAYADTVLITNCRFRVQQAGRQKTIKEKRKRVHAYVEGDFHSADIERERSQLNKVYYNPYTTEQFTDLKDGLPVLERALVFLADKVCYTR